MEELDNLQIMPAIVKRVKVERNDELDRQLRWGNKKCIQNFSGDISQKESLSRPKRRWENNIKLDLRVTTAIGHNNKSFPL